jgi:hypothetical protein
MFSLFFLLLTSAKADPQFTALKEGEPAPFAGRLFNDEAVTKIVVEDRFKIEQCNLQIDYEKEKLNLAHSYELKQNKIELESQIKILQTKVDLRDERIKDLEKLSKPIKPIFYIAGGFIVGAGATIGITYAVNQ